MIEQMKVWILSVAKVPPQPQPPEGSPESVRVFRAGRNYYRWCMILWFLGNLAPAAAMVALHFSLFPALARKTPLWSLIEGFIAAIYVLILLVTYLERSLNYEMRWYIVTDRSLRIRSGVTGVRELTMTFANIQEVRVSAGPLQNLLGLADVEVQSAGGGDAASGHVAKFQGVDNAPFIRDLIIERLRQYKDSGLGERMEQAASQTTAVEAARSVLDEVRALRIALKAG